MLKSIIVVYDSAEINGGAANVAIRSAIVLREAGYDVHYFAASGPINAEMADKGVQVKCLFMDDINHGSRIKAMVHGIWNMKARNAFEEYLTSFSNDDTVIHFHGWVKALSSSVIKTARKKGFCVFVTLHDYFTVCPNGGFYDYQKQEICHRKPMSLNCIKCNCDKRNYLQKLWRLIRQTVQDRNVRYNPEINYISISDLNESIIKPYVKSPKFNRVVNPVHLAEKQIMDCSESNVFLYIGRVSEEKGIELFCRAISELQEQYNLEGIVVGDGYMLKHIHERYPLVHFEGWKDKEGVREYIQNARALVFPSKCYEGAPLTIVEAMSAGLPCIVSDCTSAVELVSDGVNGLVFCANNISSLEEKIIEGLNDNVIVSLSQKLKETFLNQEYTDIKHLNKLLDVYNHVLIRKSEIDNESE